MLARQTSNQKGKYKMKKALSLLIALVMCFSCCVISMAAETPVLRFNDDGEFKILHICDCQDTSPANATMMEFIRHCLDKYDPDLVILGGDNTVPPKDKVDAAIEELVKPFVETQTYFTLVFGNHDREERYGNYELLKKYQYYGEGYCLAYHTDGISGVANHNLPIFGKDGKVAYNLYMFDSGTSGHKDANGNDGYECVYTDQIEWFEAVNNAYTLANGGKVIPSMAFQHIIVGEVMDVFYKEKSEVALSIDSKFCNGKDYDLTFANLSAIESGALTEPPCPGVENYGQFDALVRQGTVAVFSGHDHVNSFTVNHKGVDIVNTPGATFHSYGNDILRGARLITLYEGKTEYGSDLINLCEEVLDGADISRSKIASFFGVMLNRLLYSFIDLF